MKELGLSRRKLLRNAALGTAALALPVSRATPSAAMVKTLNFYSWTYGISFVKQRIAEFEKLAKVKINYGNTPGSKYHDALVVKFSGKTPLDVIYMIDGHLAEFVEAGWLYPIDEFPRVDEYRKEFIGPTAEALTYNGKALRPALLRGPHGVPLQRGAPGEGGHRRSSQDLGRGGPAEPPDQEQGDSGVSLPAVPESRLLDG